MGRIDESQKFPDDIEDWSPTRPSKEWQDRSVTKKRIVVRSQGDNEAARSAAVELARRTRAEQGLPFVVLDPVVLQRIGMLLYDAKSTFEGNRADAVAGKQFQARGQQDGRTCVKLAR